MKQNERRNIKLKDLIKFSKDFRLFKKQCIVLLKVQKKYRKQYRKVARTKKRKNNPFIKMCSV